MTIEELKQKREILIMQNKKEYQTRGNTQKCQEFWKEIQEIDALIKEEQK